MKSYGNVSKANDKKLAEKAMRMQGVIRAYGDDGNLHIECVDRNVAEKVFEVFEKEQPTDGVQMGSVCVWVNKEMVFDNQ